MRTYKHLLFLGGILAFSQTFAQVTVSGYVIDNKNRLLNNAKVVLKGSTKQIEAHTNYTGKYSFTDVPAGNYELIYIHDSEQVIEMLAVKNDDVEVDLTVGKQLQNSVLDGVVIKAQSVKNEIEKRGFAVNVIETKEAAVRNIQTNELLDRSVGVRVRQNGGLGAAVDYNLNGMSGNAVKIFIDGIPISTYGSSFDLNSIPPALIERIEVYKGVVPVYLSDDALGGAINIVLKRGLNSNVSASVSYGSFNTFQSNLSSLYRAEKSGFTLKASGFYNYSDNDYEIWGKFARNIRPDGTYEYVRAKRFNDAFKSKGARVEAGFTDVSWADSFLLGMNLSDSYNEIQHGLYMTVPYKDRYSKSNANVFSLDYRKRNLLLNGLDFDFNGSISNRKQLISDLNPYRYNWYGEIAKGLYGEELKTPGGAQQGAPTLNHIDRTIATFRTGLSYEFLPNNRFLVNHMFYDVDRNDRDELKSIQQQAFSGKRKLTKNITSLAYDARFIEDKLKLNVFSKFYRQDIEKTDPVLETINGVATRVDKRTASTKNDVGYGIATSYLIKPAVAILFSAERAVRLPSENEVFGNPGENMTENPGLRPEVSDNFNLGGKIGPYQINKHKISFSVSGFIRDAKDKIVRQVNDRLNDAQQVAPFENLGKTKAKGFEAEIFYSFSNRLNVGLNVSKFSSVFNLKNDPNGNEYVGRYNVQIPNEPFFTFNGNVQYSFNDVLLKKSKLFLNYGFGFVDSFYTIWNPGSGITNRDDLLRQAQTPTQLIQDIGLSYIFPNKQFVVSFDAKNIFDQQAYDNYAVQKPGRAFYVKLTYNLSKF
ncbi:TonB-dependent receptor [Flavobacterium agricola]|uniref:TonB-dependent receptor n=1 Tax=Flavobacterium agricola TaxID=2870839 RepID=A0ABY6M1E8_9FLAO|nr:TonB-dependent receptor [Flavobacterium agricola]UYW01632.1 TonB-dependent receptor [Flavobacterium agricola]